METYIPHTIRIRIPNARHVAVVGDFNNWHTAAHPLVEVAPDHWERIIDLPAGKHRYAFFVLDHAHGERGDGYIRSRVIANGAVIWVPENPEQGVSITAHPALAVRGNHEVAAAA